MNKIYLEFNSQEDANLNNDIIWVNYLINHASNSEKLVGDGAGNDYFLSEIEAMTNDQICQLKSYGKKNGVIQNTDGLTTAWAIPMEEYNNPGKWVIKKPDESLMTGVTGYVEKEYDPNWWPSELE